MKTYGLDNTGIEQGPIVSFENTVVNHRQMHIRIFNGWMTISFLKLILWASLSQKCNKDKRGQVAPDFN
jgi:hypothetical protein